MQSTLNFARSKIQNLIQIRTKKSAFNSPVPWDSYQNSIKTREKFGDLPKKFNIQKTVQTENKINQNILHGIKKKVFDPSREMDINNKRKKLSGKSALVKDNNVSYKKGKGLSDPCLNMSIRVISNGYGTGMKSFLLSSTEESYLINPGESLLRYMKSENLKIKKIENILMTRSVWESTGGMGSLTLELAPFDQPLKIHSPVDWNLSNNHRINRPFIDMMCQKVTQHSYNSENTYEDHNLKIDLIKFRKEQGNNRTNSYEITLKKSAPKFLIENLQNYENLEQGPWINDLKNGKEVTLKDGRVLYPKEFLSYESCDEKKVLVIDLPDESYICELNEVIDKKNEEIQVITHLSESKVLNNPDYLNWIKSFPTNCVHLFFDEKFPSLQMDSVYKLQAQLHLLNQEAHPLLYGQTKEFNLMKNEHKKHLKTLQKEMKIIQAESNMDLTIKPDMFLDLNKIVQPDNQNYMEQIFDHYETNLKIKADGGPSEEVKNKLNILKQRISKLDQSVDQINSDIFPKILFLGTSSSNATNHRNVTSIFVQLNKDSNMIMDCGEGTSGQLIKMFGKDKTYEELVKIKLLFLTHIHLDHHGGIYGLIKERIKAFEKLNKPYEKLKIMIPKFYVEQSLFCIENLLKENIFDKITFLPNEIFMNRTFQPKKFFVKSINIGQKYLIDEFSNFEQQQAITEVKSLLGLESIEVIAVHHIGFSYAIMIDIKRDKDSPKPFKLVFSGDCRPNTCLVTRGQKCDLLIHECTFDNGRLKDAIRKNHSTIQEAISIAEKMNARQTVLTHFSSRYGILGHIDEVNNDFVGFSFDFMYLNAENMHLINEYRELLKVLFVKHEEMNAERQNKLINREKIEASS